MWISFQRSFCSGSRGPSRRGLSPHAGFTLIELVVVVSVMLVLTSIFLIRQQQFNSSTLLRSLAYSVGLSVRQAQLYGTSIRENVSGAFDAGNAAKAYGVYFDAATPNSYILFADVNNNGVYDSGESVQAFTINSGYTISKFCATPTAGAQQCTDSPTPLTYLTLIFRRPNPDSCFATNLNASACQINAAPVYSLGYIQIMSGTVTRSVNVTLTGQIWVGIKGS